MYTIYKIQYVEVLLQTIEKERQVFVKEQTSILKAFQFAFRSRSTNATSINLF